MLDNEDRADLGVRAVRAAARLTNVWTQETASTSIKDVLAYIAHACDRAGLAPEAMFEGGLESYQGDFEDGPPAREMFDGTEWSFADFAGRGDQDK